MPTQKYLVQGLRPEDERVVAERVRSLHGVLFAIANHSDSCLEVEFEDDCVSTDEISASLRELGFDARTAG